MIPKGKHADRDRFEVRDQCSRALGDGERIASPFRMIVRESRVEFGFEERGCDRIGMMNAKRWMPRRLPRLVGLNAAQR